MPQDNRLKFIGEEVYLFCPKCKCIQLVTANMYHVERAQASVLAFPDHCEIDWDNMEIEGDFEYVCDFCGTRVADSMEDIENKLKEGADDSSLVSKM